MIDALVVVLGQQSMRIPLLTPAAKDCLVIQACPPRYLAVLCQRVMRRSISRGGKMRVLYSFLVRLHMSVGRRVVWTHRGSWGMLHQWWPHNEGLWMQTEGRIASFEEGDELEYHRRRWREQLVWWNPVCERSIRIPVEDEKAFYQGRLEIWLHQERSRRLQGLKQFPCFFESIGALRPCKAPCSFQPRCHQGLLAQAWTDNIPGRCLSPLQRRRKATAAGYIPYRTSSELEQPP